MLRTIKTLSLAGSFALLMMISVDTQAQFTAKRSETSTIAVTENSEVIDQPFAISPSAVKKTANVLIDANNDDWATLSIKNMFGEVVLEQQMAVSKGHNKVPIFFISKLEKGTYTSVLTVEGKVFTTKLVKE